MTTKKEKGSIIRELEPDTIGYEIIAGMIGGPSELLDSNSPEVKKLQEDLNKFL